MAGTTPTSLLSMPSPPMSLPPSTSSSIPSSPAISTLHHLFHSLAQHEELANMHYSNLTSFLRCARLLKDDILQPQPQSVSHLHAPLVLPPSVTNFLARVSDLSPAAVDDLWGVVGELVWDCPSPEEELRRDRELFKRYGHPLGITWHTFYPPTKLCLNPDCSARPNGTLLKKEETRCVVAFTLSDGAHPAWSVHLKCRTCHTNYHHNYSVRNNIRTYYPDVPAYLQVAEHQFVERDLAMQWMDLMQVAVSATNCARLYTIAEARRPMQLKTPWQFSTSLTTEQVWDSFCLLALLNDHTQRHVHLTLPHDGDHRDRYSAAMRARTERMIIHGQEELPHACDSCVRVFLTPDGEVTKTEAVVTDGVTIGRPCCAVPRCTNPLDSTRHRFCTVDPSHRKLEFTCAVEGCGRPVAQDGQVNHKSCDNPIHLKMESLNLESVASGKSKGQRARIAKLDNTFIATETPTAVQVPVQDGEVWYEHDDRNGAVRIVEPINTTSTGITDLPSVSSQPLSSPILSAVIQDSPTIPQCSEKTLPKKVKATFRRQRTNNEQLVVRPCGVINGRGTMYNHEAVSNVLILIEQLYSLPRARKPEHLIYDSNCNALREVTSRNLTFFKDMGMCVDAFHHKTKHKASDRFCQENCDMRAYPELVDERGKFYFNSSIAEQTNVWFGAFHNICREMTAVKYDFFLDEMILRRNRFTVATLHAQGKHPFHPRLTI